jgi:hypothetical protein
MVCVARRQSLLELWQQQKYRRGVCQGWHKQQAQQQGQPGFQATRRAWFRWCGCGCFLGFFCHNNFTGYGLAGIMLTVSD